MSELSEMTNLCTITLFFSRQVVAKYVLLENKDMRGYAVN